MDNKNKNRKKFRTENIEENITATEEIKPSETEQQTIKTNDNKPVNVTDKENTMEENKNIASKNVSKEKVDLLETPDFRVIKLNMDKVIDSRTDVKVRASALLVILKTLLNKLNSKSYKDFKNAIEVIKTLERNRVLDPIEINKLSIYFPNHNEGNKLRRIFSVLLDMVKNSKNVKKYDKDKLLSLFPETARKHIIKYFKF